MIQDINFSKYKRFFAFGCSFTGYAWPTWADILSKEMPEASYYNMGNSGSGNLLIMAKMTEANLKFNFNDTDLVIVMWTTYCREDRYHHNNWDSPGNIFTQNTYDEKWVKKFADPKGYLIRDLTLMTNATAYLKSLPCDSIRLMSVPYNYQNEQDESVKPIIEAFRDLTTSTPPSLYDLELEGIFENGHVYFNEHTNSKVEDYHPSPLRYRAYLEKLRFPLTERSKFFAEQSTSLLRSTKTWGEINKLFPNNQNGRNYFNQWW